ncbi:TIGR03943 family putative permease subunit [Couchioplanes caeruleus]|uniref:TIGR03943 family protein n=2 Tax=Couchioplanes caeruleus TaxID=56438 RepID=A0A1K0G5R7_9ACTN|nr:TIGR03943 family protein [Couchioplanes caeruleus]OJF12610.1 TIGR03943 family protein [Couchioplanes caeruleus subsp. caeruleus]ROP27624.1 putative repeat protein (TIGR03943 family) [Couchioplanes caeruleus]
MNRQAQAVIMMLFGGAILKASFGDLYLRYVKEGLRPFLIGAGLLLVAAGVMTLWYELRPRRPQPEEHHHHEPRVGWLLILPVLGLLLVAPPALGSYAAAQAGSVLAAQSSESDYPPLPAGDPVDVGLLDYASRAVFDEGRSLTGRTLRLSGFVTPGPDGEPMLARMVLSCCAADGRPIKVGLAGKGPAGVAPDTWVQVVGTYSERVGEDPVNGAEVPYLQVQSWQEIAAPKQQYE